MPYIKTEQIPNEPIFVVYFDGEVTADDIGRSFESVSDLWNEDLRRTGSHIISRAESVSASFVETMKGLLRSAQFLATNRDRVPYTTLYIVTTHPLAHFFAQSSQLPQFGGVGYIAMRTYEDALSAARQSVERRTAEKPVDSPE